MSVKGRSKVTEGYMNNPEKILAYITGGKAIFTVYDNTISGRVTYKVDMVHHNDSKYFVNVLTGSDNENNYQYMGVMVKEESGRLCIFTSANSHFDIMSRPMLLFARLLHRLQDDKRLDELNFYHSGHCARCGRLLTTPESVESGYGSECIKHI